MRTRLTMLATAVATVAIAMLVAPALALAGTSVTISQGQNPELGSVIANVPSMTYRPPGFTTDAAQVMAITKSSPTLQALHRHEHPLSIVPHVWLFPRPYWWVTLSFHGNVVAEASISPSGKLESVWTGPQAIAPYARGNYAPLFDNWWVIAPFSALFLLPFIDLRRWRRTIHLDALVLLSFMASYLLLDGGKLEPAVWLAYPPLLYLLGRMLWLAFRGSRSPSRLAPLLSTKMLIGGLALIVAARVVLALVSDIQIDVAYASVVGAHRISLGLPLYFPDPGHGDTYGPITYLAYLPFERIWGWGGAWGALPAADYAAITFDAATMLGLFFVGRRLRTGREGTRLGLVLAWVWAACPFTVLSLIVHTNDALISMLCVLCLLLIGSPAARGAMLGLAAAAKFSPAALLPLLAAPRKGRRGALVCVASFCAVVATSILLYLPPGGISEFWHRTLGFQITRPDVFSPWALHPGLKPVQTLAEVLAVALVALVAFVPKERTLTAVCALAAAVTIAVQLPAVHWFYYYILWFLPFAAVAVLAPPRPREADRARHDADALLEPERVAASEPVLAGV